jgi:dATP/dGTP diphosphohydrolase
VSFFVPLELCQKCKAPAPASLRFPDEVYVHACSCGFSWRHGGGEVWPEAGAEAEPSGRKDDQGKPRWELLPTDAVREVVQVLTFGAKKYADRNWERGIKYGRVYGAALRHLTSWWEGQDADPETGLSHLAHAGCCVLFLLAWSLRGQGETWDDRPRKEP